MPAVLAQHRSRSSSVLGVLVFVHELGHYLAARWRGVHVEVFSIGFGQAIATWRDRVGTVWKLAWLPLGGYVKLHGQERPEDGPRPEPVRPPACAGADELEPAGPGRSHEPVATAAGSPAVCSTRSRSALARSSSPPGRSPISCWRWCCSRCCSPPPAARSSCLSPATCCRTAPRRAPAFGRTTGSSRSTATPIKSFEDIQRIITAHPAEKLPLTIRRGEQTLELPVLTDSRESGGRKVGMLGIRGGQVEYQRLSLPEALSGGVTQTWQVTSETVVGRGADDQRPARHRGPWRAAAHRAALRPGGAAGLASLISFIAVLSVNLGLINLFPIPVLDGGHLLFYLAEAIRGRPIPPRAQEYGFRAGLALLAGLFIFATWNDLAHLGMFH